MKAKLYDISEDMSKRLNIMKFIFMVLVVLIHSNVTSEISYGLPRYALICKSIIWDGICVVATPGFFVISGLLLYSREFKWLDNLKKKIKTLVVPYFLINTFWIVFFKGIRLFEATRSFFQDEAYQINTFRDLAEAYFNPMPLYYPFWFIRDLFILNLAAKIIKMLIDKVPILSLVVVIALHLEIIKIPILHTNASLCMFALSYCVVKYQLKLQKMDKIKLIYWGIAYGALFVIKNWLWNYGLAGLVFSVVGICFFYQLSGKLVQSFIGKIVLWCAQFTFFIYAFHEFYAAMLKKVLLDIVPQNGIVSLVESFVIAISITVACILAGAIFRKYMPRVYGLVCGSR